MTGRLNIHKKRWAIQGSAIGIGVVATIASYFLGVHPRVAAGMRQAEQENELRLRLIEVDQIQVTFNELEQLLAISSQKLGSDPVKLHPVDHLNQELATITDLAAESTSAIHKMQSGKPVKSDLYSVVPIQVAGVGTFKSCAAFLHQLHLKCPDLGVVSIELTGQPQSGGNQIEFSLLLSWYTSGPRSGSRY